jgi:hypothetical protein
VRSQQESNSINRVLKAHGLPSLGEPGVVEALARMVEDHTHFMELLRACEPRLRRDMYEAMKPYLKFPARPLDHYVAAAQAHAAAAELPVMDEKGGLHPYNVPYISTAEFVPKAQLPAKCGACGKEATFSGSDKADAIFAMRSAGWGWDEFDDSNSICPECLDGKLRSELVS